MNFKDHLKGLEKLRDSTRSSHGESHTRKKYSHGGSIKGEMKSLSKKGRYGDSKLAEIGPRTSKVLDKVIHHGKKEINPRTGLREYPPISQSKFPFQQPIPTQRPLIPPPGGYPNDYRSNPQQGQQRPPFLGTDKRPNPFVHGTQQNPQKKQDVKFDPQDRTSKLPLDEPRKIFGQANPIPNPIPNPNPSVKDAQKAQQTKQNAERRAQKTEEARKKPSSDQPKYQPQHQHRPAILTPPVHQGRSIHDILSPYMTEEHLRHYHHLQPGEDAEAIALQKADERYKNAAAHNKDKNLSHSVSFIYIPDAERMEETLKKSKDKIKKGNPIALDIGQNTKTLNVKLDKTGKPTGKPKERPGRYAHVGVPKQPDQRKSSPGGTTTLISHLSHFNN